MKHLIIFLLLTLATTSFAQKVKIQAGLAISKLDYKVAYYDGYNIPLIGYSTFLGLDYFNKKHFNFSSNIGIIRKGGKDEFQYSNSTPQESKTVKLDYLSINTQGQLKFPIQEKLIPFLSFGPRLDYLINSENMNIFRENDGYKRLSYGLITGFGLAYKLNNIQIGLQYDYYITFNKIIDMTIEYEPIEIPDGSSGPSKIEMSDYTSSINFSVVFNFN